MIASLPSSPIKGAKELKKQNVDSYIRNFQLPIPHISSNTETNELRHIENINENQSSGGPSIDQDNSFIIDRAEQKFEYYTYDKAAIYSDLSRVKLISFDENLSNLSTIDQVKKKSLIPSIRNPANSPRKNKGTIFDSLIKRSIYKSEASK